MLDLSGGFAANLLIVDGTPAGRGQLLRAFGQAGFTVREAATGREALDQAARGHDLILLNVTLPDLDGFEVCRLLKSHPATASIPVVLHADGPLTTEHEARGRECGADGYLDRAAGPAALAAQIHAFLRIRQAEARLKQVEEELSRANRARDDFLGMLAHELRNPLAPVLNGLHILRLSGTDRQALEQARTIMERQLNHLSKLVDDLLDVTRMTRGKVQLHRERLDLARLVRSAGEDYRATLEQAGLTFTLEVPETPVWVMGDATRLLQGLGNLLENAVKFTDRGGRVRVRLAVAPGAKEAVLSVRDTGIGIEPDMLPNLFDVFAQGDHSLHRTRGGLGLGLAVVKSLVELHGGEVRATSAGAGQGAEFTIRLPLQAEPPALTALAAPPAPAGERLRVLVVEDNRDAAASLRLLLELLNYEVHVVHSGPAGVREATEWKPDVVLCDIGLPGLDGYGVAGQLRRSSTTARARLIAITGYGRDEDLFRSRQAGFDHHLTKPVDPGLLLRLLTRPGS